MRLHSSSVRPAESLFGSFAAEKKQDVEVGVGKKKPAPISAQRHQTQSFGRSVVNAKNLAKNLLNIIVRERAQGEHRFPRADTRLELFLDTVPFIVGLRAENGQGSKRVLHFHSGRMGRKETGTGCGRHQRAFSPRSSLRIRIASSTFDKNILPSPIFPVLAVFRMVSTTVFTSLSGSTISSLIFGSKSTVYSRPRYTSVCPFCRPCPRTSATVKI